MRVYSVFDSAVKAYMQPFFSKTHGEAIRSFSDACEDGNSMFKKHAADFTLFHIGEFDEQQGQLVPVTPVNLGNALQYVKSVHSGLPRNASHDLDGSSIVPVREADSFHDAHHFVTEADLHGKPVK